MRFFDLWNSSLQMGLFPSASMQNVQSHFQKVILIYFLPKSMTCFWSSKITFNYRISQIPFIFGLGVTDLFLKIQQLVNFQSRNENSQNFVGFSESLVSFFHAKVAILWNVECKKTHLCSQSNLKIATNKIIWFCFCVQLKKQN